VGLDHGGCRARGASRRRGLTPCLGRSGCDGEGDREEPDIDEAVRSDWSGRAKTSFASRAERPSPKPPRGCLNNPDETPAPLEEPSKAASRATITFHPG